MSVPRLVALLVAVALVAAVAAPAALASPPAQLKLLEVDPPDGAVLKDAPARVNFCFSEPLVQDLDLFSFVYLTPDGKRLGLRIEFSLGNRCLATYVGLAPGYPAGEHTLEWLVTADESREQASGLLRYQVTEARTPTPTPPPARTPAATPTQTPDAAAEGEVGGDGGPDTLAVALLAAAAGVVALAGVLAFLFRRALGFGRSSGGEDGPGPD
jgi:methionine-rich copper-binding protein CopC